MDWLRRLFHREHPHIPDELWSACIERLPFLKRLAEPELDKLKSLCETFLDKKSFTAAADFELTDEIVVMIAAQACLPILNLSLDLYDDMAGIIVYPAAFIIPQRELDEAGVMHEWQSPASGEAIGAGGAVVLSWQDAQEGQVRGGNVVIHEFVHKIDMADGGANGYPPFLSQYHEHPDANRWPEVFSSAYNDFLQRVNALEARLPGDFDDDRPDHADLFDALSNALPLDPYAASHPAEFFAVASEAFFVRPEPLASTYPAVYRLLAKYFRQDPLAS